MMDCDECGKHIRADDDNDNCYYSVKDGRTVVKCTECDAASDKTTVTHSNLAAIWNVLTLEHDKLQTAVLDIKDMKKEISALHKNCGEEIQR